MHLADSDVRSKGPGPTNFPINDPRFPDSSYLLTTARFCDRCPFNTCSGFCRRFSLLRCRTTGLKQGRFVHRGGSRSGHRDGVELVRQRVVDVLVSAAVREVKRVTERVP